MDGILDQVLDATPIGGTRVLGQQHDVNQITVDGTSELDSAMRSIAGIWDAAEMGITKEEVERRIREADTPEARQKIIAQVRARAIRRAALDTSTGKVAVMVAGDLPWHGLGVNVADAVGSDDAIKLASLDWLVSKRVMYYRDAAGNEHVSDDVFAICREDTGAKLGTVGSKYAPIQNVHAFKFMDSVLGEFGAKYETAGAVFGGEKVWMLVRLPQQRFTLGKTDTVEPYAIFTNPHDGSGKAYCYPTTVRVVCNNTLRVSGAEKGKGIGIRHTGDVKAKIKEAQHALGLAVQEVKEFRGQAELLSRSKLVDPPAYFNGVLDAVLDMTEANALMGADALAAALIVTEVEDREKQRVLIQKRIDARKSILDDILDRYEGDRCGINGMRGTAWSGLNAVTEFADHSDLVRYRSRDAEVRNSRRFESTLAGDADEMKQVALTHALAAAAKA